MIIKLVKRAVTMVIAVGLAMAQFAHGQELVVPPDQAKAYFIHAPRPQYPYEARARRIFGRGIFRLNVNPKDGTVRSVTVVRSTGSPILDKAAVSALRSWVAQPGTATKVLVPVNYTL